MAALNVAVIGYGMSAKIFHIPFILALPTHYKLHSVLQRTPTPDNNCTHDHPEVKHHTSTDDLLSDPSIDLIIITTPPSTHYTLCKSALEAQKHVLCEKPFVPTSAQALELSSLANQQSKTLTIYQNRRYDADFLILHSLLTSGKLGRIAELSSHFDRHRPSPPASAASTGWKISQPECGGAIWDLGTHLLDQFFVLFGLPERVTAFLTKQRVYEVEGTGGEVKGGDSFTVLLHYDALGMVGEAKAGIVSPMQEQLRFVVKGTRGGWAKSGLDVQEPQLKDGLRPGDEKFGVDGAIVQSKLTIAKDDGSMEVEQVAPEAPTTYTRFYELLADAIASKGGNPVSAEENAKVIELIEACFVSSKEGRTVSLS